MSLTPVRPDGADLWGFPNSLPPTADDIAVAEPFLPVQLARTAEAAGRLIGQGLMDRGLSGFSLTDETGGLNEAIATLAYAYEAALLTDLTPDEVRTLRRLLTRVEAAALKLSGRG